MPDEMIAPRTRLSTEPESAQAETGGVLGWQAQGAAAGPDH